MRHFRLLLTLCLPVVVAACAGGSPTAPLPAYGWGDAYRFDNGTTHSVEAASATTVRWREDGRSTEVTTRDILLPPLSQSDAEMTVRRRLEGNTQLFPLIPGKRVAFSSRTEWLPRHRGKPSVAEESWSCRVGDPTSIVTQAGRFDTLRVDCQTRVSNSAQILQRTYFYAPSIGYYVKREDRVQPGAERVTTLVGYTIGNPALPDAALNQRVRAIQLALERRVSGDPVHWRDAGDDASGSVDPVMTVRSAQLGWCREFQEKMQVAERRYALLGTACRAPGGIWQVQQVRPFRTATR